jgi:hypothetical protein
MITYRCFNGKVELAKNTPPEVAAGISSLLGLIFFNLGILSKALGYNRAQLKKH